MSPRSSDPLRFEYILLGLLNQQASTGYDLYKRINRSGGISLIWHLHRSQLYALLSKLETKGYLVSRRVPDEVFPDKKEFSLSENGKAALETWMSQPVSRPRDVRQEFLARFYFAQQSGAERASALVNTQIEICQGWLDQMTQSAERIEAWQTYEQLVLQFRLTQVRGILTWLVTCREKFAASPRAH